MGDTLLLLWNGGGSEGVSGANAVASTPIRAVPGHAVPSPQFHHNFATRNLMMTPLLSSAACQQYRIS